MTTTIGTETEVSDLLKDLVALDFDAVAAYNAAVDRLEDPEARKQLTAFRGDHERHIRDLQALMHTIGMEPPQEGDMKSMLTRGKVVIAGLSGDRAILQAMLSNEEDTNTAYERAAKREEMDAETRELMSRNFADERRHREWIEGYLGD